LFLIVGALDPFGCCLAARQRWQQHCGENCYNRNHYEQFNQGKPLKALASSAHIRAFEGRCSLLSNRRPLWQGLVSSFGHFALHLTSLFPS